MAAEMLVKGASVVDGTGAEPFAADVLIGDNGLITAVRRRGGAAPAQDTEVIDGSGLVLAPGFVDLHSHSDLYSAVREEGSLPIGDVPKLSQGCTSQTFGQDGISAAPVDDDHLEDQMALLAGLDGTIPLEAWTWRSYSEYLAVVRDVSATRTFGLVGHSTIRRHVMGYAAREATGPELEEMQRVLAEALAGGAAGLSSGLVYVPAVYSGTAELVALCEVAARHDKPFFVHVRSEGDRVEEATDEVIDVCASTGCHLHYSHIKAAGQANWHKAASLLSKISAARDSGVSITADIHPYVAGSTTANVLLPPWLFEGGGVASALERLSDRAVRGRARAELLGGGWENWLRFSGGWRGLRVAGASDESIVGRSFADVIEAGGVSDLDSEAAFDIVFDLLAREQLAMSLVSFNNVEENVAGFFAEPYCSVGTDAVVNPGGHPHPRLYGTFPRVLGRFVRELGVVSLPEAVRKMTSQAAEIIGRKGQLGEVRAGLPADLVLFDPTTVADRATFESPRELPSGIERVIVGGRSLVEGGRVLSRRPR
ncbi:MAG: N-acyl-D-amino-acid deacylase family protein [Acidimicrobiales bacterium]